jgi:hypothetical protein
MADMQMLFRTIDELSLDERHQLKEYLEERERTTWWVVPPENIAKMAEVMRPVQEDTAKMTEEEVNAAIDEALAEVRNERKHRQSRH